MLTFKKYLQINEGGWGTTLNQNTRLTPALVKKTVKVAEEFFKDLNGYLTKENLEEVEFLGPVGSVSYYTKDEIDQPDKEYGDIDTLISIPRLDNMTEYKNVQTYYNKILDFVNSYDTNVVIPTPEAKTAGQFIMIKVGDDVVQVDLIFTFTQTKDWAKSRYKPEHNVKGALFGNLLSSLAETLHLSIQGYGVQAKFKDGMIVPFRTQKAQTKTLSVNPKEFMIDILKFVAGDDAKVHNDLKKYPGFKQDDIKIENIAHSIKGLAKSFTLNNSYAVGHLKSYANEDEFVNKIGVTYKQKMDKAIGSTKFDKASTEISVQKAKQIKKQFSEVSQKIIDVLKS